MPRTILSLLAVFAAAVCLRAAEAPKIAVVDMEKVFNSYYKTKIVQSFLEEQQNVYRTHLATLNRELQQQQDEYKVLLDAAQNLTLKDSERQEKAKLAAAKLVEVKQSEADIQQYFTEKARQFQQLEDTKRKEVTGDIVAEVQRRAVIENVDIVFDLSGKTTSNLGCVIYFKPNLDLTDKVTEELNRGNREAQKNLPQPQQGEEKK